MHMSDALISPTVGGLFWAATGALLAISAYRLQRTGHHAARMGVMGAFVFAAQMINFAIPGTGSSGHLGGGLLLAIVLGPWAAFLTIAAVLLVQALFFADGGLLAWGANVFNLGFFTSCLAYPLIFKPMAGHFTNRARVMAASVVAAMAGLQLAAFGVVVETFWSGISALPFLTFVTLMLPVHLAIGLVEGMVTAGMVTFLLRTAPETVVPTTSGGRPPRWPWPFLAITAALLAGVVSLFASENPDGLEWAIGKATGKVELDSPRSAVHGWFSHLQEHTSLLPDYTFAHQPAASTQEVTADPGTSVAGLLGGILAFGFTTAWAVLLRRLIRKRPAPAR